MKSVLASLFLLCVGFTQAQSVSDYQNIIVKKTFKDFEKEDYQLNLLLRSNLRKKKYEVFSEDATNIPTEIQNNECLAAKADIQNIKASFQNKLKVVFTDCNNNVIGEYFGASKIKDFEKGYQDALNDALKTLIVTNPKATPTVIKVEKNETEIIKEKPKTNKEVVTVVKKNSNYYYSNEKPFEFVAVNGKYNLVDVEQKKIIAEFYPSTQKNVYHVNVIQDNSTYQTIGFMTGNTLIIEYQTSGNTWQSTSYSK